mgnify:CR=1 FL=1
MEVGAMAAGATEVVKKILDLRYCKFFKVRISFMINETNETQEV